MNDLAEPPHGMRRAALTLHALDRADRTWLLEQLSEGQRELLEPLLADLQALGIPRDRALVQDALASEASPAVTMRALPDAKALCLALAREPQAARSLWLAALQASERQDVLRHWPLPLEQPPAVVAASNWSAALGETIRQVWGELAREEEKA